MIRATSKAAERRNRRHKQAQKAALYQLIKRRPVNGYTRNELASKARIKLQTVCPRVVELLEEGAIGENGNT